MIDAMFQEGTDKALDDQVQRPRLAAAPRANAFSFAQLLKSPGKGIGAGVAETIAFGSEVSGAFGQVLGATGTDSAGGMFATQNETEKKQAEAARQKLMTQGIEFSNEAGDLFRERAKQIMPDPETAHASEQVTAGLFRFATKATGYVVAGGAVPGAAMLGFDEGLTEADRLKQQGVDIETRTTAGAVAGGVAGASMLIPMTGATMAGRFVKGVAVGEGTMIGQAAAEKLILQNAGYDKIASTFDPFDPVSLAVGLVPGLLGAKFGRPSAKQLAALKTESDVRTAAALSPDEQARSAAFERSAANIKELEAAIKSEKDAGNRLTLVNELEKQRTAHRDNYVKDSMRAEPDMEPAARVRQVVDALDESRLTPDSDLRGMAAHQEAIETAHEQIARGEPVNVRDVLPEDAGLYRGSFTTLDAMEGQGLPGPGFKPTELNDRTLYTGRDGRKYTLVFDPDAHTVSALDQTGQRVGELMPAPLSGYEIKEGVKSQTAWMGVDEAHQRNGLNTAMHQLASDKMPGFQWESNTFTGDGKAWFDASSHREGMRLGPDLRAPARTAAAATELRAAREEAQNPPHAQTAAPEATARNAGDAASVRPAVEPVAAKPAAGDGADPGAAAVSKASSEVATLNPDLLVQLDGMDAPMRVADLMAKVKEEAAHEAQMAKLVQVAAECALSA